MPLSDDVLRGLRWGAILLVGLAIGVATYRLVLEPPPKASHEKPPENIAPPVGPIQKRVGPERPAVVTTGSRTVPPPPPQQR